MYQGVVVTYSTENKSQFFSWDLFTVSSTHASRVTLCKYVKTQVTPITLLCNISNLHLRTEPFPNTGTSDFGFLLFQEIKMQLGHLKIKIAQQVYRLFNLNSLCEK